MNGQRKTYITAAVAVIVVLGIGGWLWARHSKAKDEQLVEVKFGNDKPIKLHMSGGELSDKDHKQMQDFAAARRKEMLDGYFNANEKDRVKKLDEMIDQQEAMRKEMGEIKLDGPTTIPSTQPGKDTPKMVIRRGDPKMGTEGIPAADRARMAELTSALNARRAERGLPPQNGVMMVFKSGDGAIKGGK